jgi:hypothetical protein
LFLSAVVNDDDDDDASQADVKYEFIVNQIQKKIHFSKMR